MPSEDRTNELIAMITEELHENPGAELSDYHEWDHLIENDRQHDDVMSFEEWEWCRDNLDVRVQVSVSVREPSWPATTKPTPVSTKLWRLPGPPRTMRERSVLSGHSRTWTSSIGSGSTSERMTATGAWRCGSEGGGVVKWSDPQAQFLVGAATHLARWLHRDQEDLQGQPYWLHLERVAEYVVRHDGTPEQVATAYLHDSIEDGVIDYDTLYSIFPGNTTTWVFMLARDKKIDTYQEYIDRLCSIREIRPVLLVKLADLLDNMDRSRPAPESLIKRNKKALQKIRAAMEEVEVAR